MSVENMILDAPNWLVLIGVVALVAVIVYFIVDKFGPTSFDVSGRSFK